MGPDFSQFHDGSLIREIQKGNHDAFTVLLNRHSKRFYSIVFRLVFERSHAEDIVQEAFLKLWDKPHLWKPAKQAKFTTWFYRIVINLCLDFIKKKKPLLLLEDMTIADNNPGQDALLDSRQKQVLLDALIKELPERQQLALNLCFYEGLSNKEAAEIIGVKLKALQSLVMRAKMTLKKRIKPFLDGDSI